MRVCVRSQRFLNPRRQPQSLEYLLHVGLADAEHAGNCSLRKAQLCMMEPSNLALDAMRFAPGSPKDYAPLHAGVFEIYTARFWRRHTYLLPHDYNCQLHRTLIFRSMRPTRAKVKRVSACVPVLGVFSGYRHCIERTYRAAVIECTDTQVIALAFDSKEGRNPSFVAGLVIQSLALAKLVNDLHHDPENCEGSVGTSRPSSRRPRAEAGLCTLLRAGFEASCATILPVLVTQIRYVPQAIQMEASTQVSGYPVNQDLSFSISGAM